MHKQTILSARIEVLDIHARRLSFALGIIKPLTPISAQEIADITDEQIAFLEQLYLKFTKYVTG
jgi:hypothetical protein